MIKEYAFDKITEIVARKVFPINFLEDLIIAKEKGDISKLENLFEFFFNHLRTEKEEKLYLQRQVRPMKILGRYCFLFFKRRLMHFLKKLLKIL